MNRHYRQRPPAVQAGQLECPSCAGGVPVSKRSCPHCGNDTRPRRCANCYHANAADASLCEGCAEVLGLEPVASRADLSCKACSAPFEVFATGAGALYDCARCGGQFAQHSVVRQLISERELLGRNASGPIPQHNPLDSPLRYTRCPECGEVMNRKNFGARSGVIVDECLRHGVWFDHGELPRILRFVASGGLALARPQQSRPAETPRGHVQRSLLHAELAASVIELISYLTFEE